MQLRPSSFRRITSSGDFLPEIDGFRFLAITAVVCAHVVLVFGHNEARGFPEEGPANPAYELVKRGTYGVEFFFVISGFILALPFVRHLQHGGPPVRIGRYYLRRLTRLEPPYILTLLGFTAASFALGETDMARGEYLPSLVARLGYAHCLWYGRPPVLNGVTWTLEVEVMFYLLVPLLAGVFRLPVLARRGLLLAIMVLWPCYPWSYYATITLPAFVHYFAAGFLLADLYLDVIVPRPQAKLRYDLLALAVFTTIWVWPVTGGQRPKPLALLILAFYFLVFRSVYFRRLFTNPWITAIGGMCYSIYLLHYPLLVLVDRILWKIAPTLDFARGTLGLATVGIPAIAVVAGAFFLLVERPCMDPRWPARAWSRLTGRGPLATRPEGAS